MKKFINIIVGISFIFYLFLLVELLFLSSRGYWTDMPFFQYMKLSSNFVPFKTISNYIRAMYHQSINMDIPIKNLAGNVILFLPMGIYLPFYLKKQNKLKHFAMTMVVMILGVEVTQLVTRLGSFDIDDFILNFIGALVGFGIWKIEIVQKLLLNNKSYF